MKTKERIVKIINENIIDGASQCMIQTGVIAEKVEEIITQQTEAKDREIAESMELLKYTENILDSMSWNLNNKAIDDLSNKITNYLNKAV